VRAAPLLAGVLLACALASSALAEPAHQFVQTDSYPGLTRFVDVRDAGQAGGEIQTTLVEILSGRGGDRVSVGEMSVSCRWRSSRILSEKHWDVPGRVVESQIGASEQLSQFSKSTMPQRNAIPLLCDASEAKPAQSFARIQEAERFAAAVQRRTPVAQIPPPLPIPEQAADAAGTYPRLGDGPLVVDQVDYDPSSGNFDSVIRSTLSRTGDLVTVTTIRLLGQGVGVARPVDSRSIWLRRSTFDCAAKTVTDDREAVGQLDGGGFSLIHSPAPRRPARPDTIDAEELASVCSTGRPTQPFDDMAAIVTYAKGRWASAQR